MSGLSAQVELRHLRYFVAVAEELNFTRAAERLHVAQPALSAQIRALEARLGCKLLARTTRKVELTGAGRCLLDDARKILEQADAALARVQAAGRGELGKLRIGFAAHGAGEVGSGILSRFARDFPAVHTELVSATTLEELQRKVVERETDVAFAWLPLLYPELDRLVVLAERKFVAMHPQHHLAAKSAVRAGELAVEPIVGPWEYMPPRLIEAWFDPFRPSGRQPGDPGAMSVDESLAFVSRGLALYCVPESATRFYARPDVVFRPIVGVAPAEVGIAWRRDEGSAAVKSFVRCAAESVAGASTIHRVAV